jgi:hypothetical protein
VEDFSAVGWISNRKRCLFTLTIKLQDKRLLVSFIQYADSTGRGRQQTGRRKEVSEESCTTRITRVLIN